MSKIVKCHCCGGLCSLEWGNRTIHSACNYRAVKPKRGRCGCPTCRSRQADPSQQEMFDLITGAPTEQALPRKRGR